MIKRALTYVLVIILIIFISGCTTNGNAERAKGNEEKVLTLKLGHVTPPIHGWHETSIKLKEELEKRSDGKITLEIYPQGQLGSEADMVQQITSGSLDFGLLTTAYVSTREEAFNAWFMPFLFSGIEDAREARTSQEAEAMLEKLSDQGLHGMGFAFAGNRHILMKNGMIKNPSDLKGEKIRIIGSPAMNDFWSMVDASPTPMPLSEVYTSLQTGIIDGIDIDLDALVALNLNDIAEDLTLSNQMAFPAVAVMSDEVREQLTDKQRKIVDASMEAALKWGFENAVAREEKNLKLLKEQGLNIYNPEGFEEFQEVKQRLYKKYGDKNKIIRSFIEANN